MAITYFDWRAHESDFPYYGVLRDACAQAGFDGGEEDYITFHNDENGKYAVYHRHAHGCDLCSLAEHFAAYVALDRPLRPVNLNDDDLIGEFHLRLAEHAAVCGGFSMKRHHVPTITWRELTTKYKAMPRGIRDKPVLVRTSDGEFHLAKDVYHAIGPDGKMVTAIYV